MKLLGRTTRPSDLSACAGIVRDRFLYDEAALRDLREMWQSIIARDIGRSAVVYEEAHPEHVLAFGVSAAVDKARFDRIIGNGEPFIGKGLLDEWRLGRNPFLDEASFASANANGALYFVVLHNGVAPTFEGPKLPTALAALSETFLTQHGGSNMSALAHESYGVPREFAVNLGMQVIAYAPSREAELAGLPAERRPLMIAMTREQAERQPGNLVLYQLFLRFTPPRCNLRTAERQLLRFALEGTPDEDVARIFAIAPQTLKKRWANIYTAMEPVLGLRSGGSDGSRGAEVRRHVLRYIREHPEELHAYAK